MGESYSSTKQDAIAKLGVDVLVRYDPGIEDEIDSQYKHGSLEFLVDGQTLSKANLIIPKDFKVGYELGDNKNNIYEAMVFASCKAGHMSNKSTHTERRNKLVKTASDISNIFLANEGYENVRELIKGRAATSREDAIYGICNYIVTRNPDEQDTLDFLEQMNSAGLYPGIINGEAATYILDELREKYRSALLGAQNLKTKLALGIATGLSLGFAGEQILNLVKRSYSSLPSGPVMGAILATLGVLWHHLRNSNIEEGLRNETKNKMEKGSEPLHRVINERRERPKLIGVYDIDLEEAA